MAEPMDVALFMEETRNVARGWIPAQASVPFARGELHDASALQLVDGDAALPLQTSVLAVWPPDEGGRRSVKWLLLDFLVDLGRSEQKRLRLTDSPRCPAASKAPGPLHLEEDAAAIRVRTGPLSFTVPKRTPTFLEEVRYLGKSVPLAGLRLVVKDEAGDTYESSAQGLNVHIEENGPVKAVVRVQGRHLAADGRRCTDFRFRLTCHAGEHVIRLQHAFVNCEDAEYLMLRRVGIEVISGSEGRVAWYNEQAMKSGWCLCAGSDLVLRTLDESGQVVAENPKAVRLVAVPIAYGTEEMGIIAAVKHFVEQYPKAYRVRDDALEINLRPDGEPFRYYCGMGKTHEVLLGFYGSEIERKEAATLVMAHLQLPRAAPDEDWMAHSMAVRGVFAAGRKWGAYPRIELALKDVFMNRDAYYGMLDWGDDIGWGYTNSGRGGKEEDGPYAGQWRPVWNNFEYDFPFVAFHQYVRTGEDYYFEEGEVAVQHMMGVDYLHHGVANDARPIEFQRDGVALHVRDHTCNPHWSPCHTFIGGMLSYYLLTGDREALTKAQTIGERLGWYAQSAYGRHPLEQSGRLSREYAWPLIALCDLYDATNEEKYVGYARTFVDLIREWEARSPTLCDTGFGVMLCCTGLGRYHAVTGEPDTRELFLRLMRTAIEKLHMPEGILRISRAERRPGCYGGRPGHGTLGCEALAYAHKLTGDPEFVRIGLREFAYLFDSGLFRRYVWQARLGGGRVEDFRGHTRSLTYIHPAGNREIALHIRHLFPLLETAHELGLLKDIEYLRPNAPGGQ